MSDRAGKQGCDPTWEREIIHLAKTYWEARLERRVACWKHLEFLGREWESLRVSEQGYTLPGIQGDDSASTPGRPPPLPPQGSPRPPFSLLQEEGLALPCWTGTDSWQRLPRSFRTKKKCR